MESAVLLIYPSYEVFTILIADFVAVVKKKRENVDSACFASRNNVLISHTGFTHYILGEGNSSVRMGKANMNQHLLFHKLPTQLFSPLAAPGAAFYSEALLVLFVETQRHQEPLSRELALGLVIDVLVEQNAFEMTADLGEEIFSDEEDAIRRRAGAVLRYLTHCRWLHEVIQNDFTIVYTLPDYAFRLLAIFHEIAHDTRLPLQGLICAIHDLLQAALRDGNAHIRIPQAHRETMRLLNGLKELQHNIGVHIETVLRQLSPHDVLEHTFGSYLREVTRRTYHELRTTDHVSRFRPNINAALAIMYTHTYLSSVEKENASTTQTQSLSEQIQDIQAHFNTLDNLLNAIDARHRQFFDVAIRSVESKLTADSTTSGHLRTILTALLDTQKSGTGADQMGDSFQEQLVESLVNLHELSLVDDKSLMSPRRPREPFTSESEESNPLTDEEIEAAREVVLGQMLRSISREQVRAYAHKLLRDREERRADDFPLAGPDDLPMLIYLRAYGNGSLGYIVEELPDADKVQGNEIEFRNFLIRCAAETP